MLAGLLREGEQLRVTSLLERLGFRLWDNALSLRDENGERRVLSGLKEFQEHLGGELAITLLAGIGCGVEVNVMHTPLIEQAIDWLRVRARSAGSIRPG